MSNELQIKDNGLVKLSSLEDGFRFSRAILQSGLAPKAFQSEQAILIAMQMGAELGLPPLMSLKLIKVVNGTPSLGGKDMPAVVLRSGLLEKWDEWFDGNGDGTTAHCKVIRKGGTERSATFSVVDARKAGLWGKAGPWAQYPQDMLMYKARSRAFQLFSDVLAGLPVAEDIQEVGQSTVKTQIPAQSSGDPLLAGAKQVEATVLSPEPAQEPRNEQAVVAEPASPPSAPAEAAPPAPPARPKKRAGSAGSNPVDSKPSSVVSTGSTPANELGEKANLLASGTAGQPIEKLRERVDQMFDLIGKDMFTKALSRADLSIDKVQEFDAPTLRKVLCECAEEANALF